MGSTIVSSTKVLGCLKLDRKILALETRIARLRQPFDERIALMAARRDARIANHVARLAEYTHTRILKRSALTGGQLTAYMRARGGDGLGHSETRRDVRLRARGNLGTTTGEDGGHTNGRRRPE
jgi:hypothetical protein